MAYRKSLDFLPGIFQTQTNEKLLRATMDQLIAEPEVKQLNGYIGRKFNPALTPGDSYISEDFIREVGAMIKPGTSAIFAILRTYNPTIVVDKLSKYGGTLLKTSLNPEQDELIQAVLSHRGKA